jgi:transcriptional regulator with XRE-family HTH domain
MSGGAKAMGERLQELRQAKGLSQSQLAKATGVPVGSLKNWEQGIRLPRLDAAWQLAKALGITLDELAGKVFESPPERAKGERSAGKPTSGPSGEKKPVRGQGRKRKGS